MTLFWSEGDYAYEVSKIYETTEKDHLHAWIESRLLDKVGPEIIIYLADLTSSRVTRLDQHQTFSIIWQQLPSRPDFMDRVYLEMCRMRSKKEVYLIQAVISYLQ